MGKTAFLFLTLFFLFSQNSNAAFDTYDIEISCAQEKPMAATIMIELESKNWSWQCDDLGPYTYKSDVWVHPGNVTLEMPNATYEVDKAESDARFNKGTIESYWNEDVSCAALIPEYEKEGISAFYRKNWSHGAGYDQHGFSLIAPNGETLVLYLNLKGYYDSAFTLINGLVERPGVSENCRISAVTK